MSFVIPNVKYCCLWMLIIVASFWYSNIVLLSFQDIMFVNNCYSFASNFRTFVAGSPKVRLNSQEDTHLWLLYLFKTTCSKPRWLDYFILAGIRQPCPFPNCILRHENASRGADCGSRNLRIRFYVLVRRVRTLRVPAHSLGALNEKSLRRYKTPTRRTFLGQKLMFRVVVGP